MAVVLRNLKVLFTASPKHVHTTLRVWAPPMQGPHNFHVRVGPHGPRRGARRFTQKFSAFTEEHRTTTTNPKSISLEVRVRS